MSNRSANGKDLDVHLMERGVSTRDRFRWFASSTANAVGSPAAFLASVSLLVLWGVAGPFFRFSDSWQLVINTGTTIVTFLMVFLIQNTQNRDAKAIHLKLDELIRSVKGARNRLVCLENLRDDELAELEKEFTRLRDWSSRPPGETSPEGASPKSV